MARPVAETRRKIVESAMMLFAVHGFERTSLLDIAADAGVRGGSIYHFFGTKRELLEAVLETYLEMLVPHGMATAFAQSDDPVSRGETAVKPVGQAVKFRKLTASKKATLQARAAVGSARSATTPQTADAHSTAGGDGPIRLAAAAKKRATRET